MRRPGIYGPYQHRNKWRNVVINEAGEQTFVSYESREAAQRDKDEAAEEGAQQGGITVTLAIDKYESWCKARGLKPNTYETTRARLDKFLAVIASKPLAMISDLRAHTIYSDWITKSAGDTHLNMLAETKTFMNWCVSQGWIKRSPFAKVKGVGKKKKGKPQLHNDEARKWAAVARGLAVKEEGAIAAIMTIEMGMRASEIAGVVVRDLDDGGELLWIDDAKTPSGRRKIEVPDLLRAMLLHLASGKAPTDPLFGPDRTRYWVYYWVGRICELAGVPHSCPHAMRGLHATMAREAGATSKLVAAQLGHASDAVTERHYIAPGVTAKLNQRAALAVLAGGKK